MRFYIAIEGDDTAERFDAKDADEAIALWLVETGTDADPGTKVFVMAQDTADEFSFQQTVARA